MADAPLDSQVLNEWLNRIRSGDLNAREELLRKVCGSLERLARKMLQGYPSLPPWLETEDVLQNSMMRLLRSLDQVKPDSVRAFFGLAATQIRRELLDLARKWGRRPEHFPLQEEDSDFSYDPRGRIREANDLDAWTSFHQEVENLPPEEREVVGLIHYHGWSKAEVAEIFQVDERTVRRWWDSARAHLQHRLKDLPPL